MSANHRTIRLKEERAWFAAGESFRRALCQLSDGAFKLFAWLCLEARLESGQVQATQKELASALGKSKRVIGRWSAELEANGVCSVEPGTNQHERTRFQICDAYWPYHRSAPLGASLPASHANSSQAYVARVRDWFVSLECGKVSFSASDAEFAAELERRGVPLQTVEDALLLGAARKYQSWLNGGLSAPIASLRYFEDLLEETTLFPFTDDYRAYLRGKIRQFAAAAARKALAS